MKFYEEDREILIRLFIAEEFGAGILYAVRVPVGSFEYLQDLRIIFELINSIVNIRKDLGVRGPYKSVYNVGYTSLRYRETVLVNNHLFVDLRNKAA